MFGGSWRCDRGNTWEAGASLERAENVNKRVDDEIQDRTRYNARKKGQKTYKSSGRKKRRSQAKQKATDELLRTVDGGGGFDR